jgi:hypothetical protein
MNKHQDRLEVLTAVRTKMAVFWVVVWEKFTDVSEALATSIIRSAV